MQSLDELIGHAQTDAGAAAAVRTIAIRPVLSLTAGEAEVARVMQICNACRYCEGFCAVFPAMTRRLEFVKADTHYLSNLCHSCGACLHACQYAAPHEFDVNVPKAMAQVRVQTYHDYAWPEAMGALYARAGLAVAIALAGSLALFLILAVTLTGSLVHEPLNGNFYAVFPHGLLAALFGCVSVFVVAALGVGAARFWRAVAPGIEEASRGDAGSAEPLVSGLRLAAAGEAAHDALRLKYLGGGHGEGCNDEDDRFTLWRRRFHHLTFYGFMLCFASTCVATLYHYALRVEAPYALTSWPVVLGTLGGLGLVAGPAGLLWLGFKRDPAHGDPAQRPMDRGFIALLLLTSITGLALLVLRDTRLMALLLAVHLGVVMALFLTLPYGKFAHGAFRCAALFKYSFERRLPSRLALGDD